MAVGPDTYTERTAASLTGEDFEVLAVVWPAAFVAAGQLVVLVYEGEVEEDDELLTTSSLMDLVGMVERGEL